MVTGFESSPNFYRTIDFANSTFLISANNSAQTAHTVIFSTDGVTWTQNSVATTPGGFRSEGIAFGAGVYLYVTDTTGGAVPRVYTSADLVTWTQRTTGFAANASLARPARGNGQFLLVQIGAANYATSPNGSVWTQRSSYVPHAWETVVFDGTRFVASVMGTGNTPILAFSTDAINWTEGTATLSFTAATMLGNNGSTQYVVGNGSNDTGNALPNSLASETTFSFNDGGNGTEALKYGLTNYARCNQNTATLQRSSDGTTWTQDTVPAAASFFQDIGFGLSEFIAIGGDQSGNNYTAFRPG